jgi:hypothetical protein
MVAVNTFNYEGSGRSLKRNFQKEISLSFMRMIDSYKLEPLNIQKT